jgi:hypothetical protein
MPQGAKAKKQTKRKVRKEAPKKVNKSKKNLI